MTKITYFDGERELYSHNLDADRIMIDGKVVWWKEAKELKVGDKVRWSKRINEIGVVKYPSYGIVAFIKFGDELQSVYQNELIKIDEPQFKVGDYVKCKYHYGYGKIVYIDTINAKCTIRYKDECISYIDITELTKIEEPEFSIGDYVRVNNNRLFDYQKCGKVVNISYKQCLIEFSDYNIERTNRANNWSLCELDEARDNGHFYWHSYEDLEKVK